MYFFLTLVGHQFSILFDYSQMAKLNLLGNKLFFRSRLLGVAILLLGSLILFLYFSLSGLLKTKNKFVNEIAYYAKMSNEVSRLNNELEYITNQQQQYLLYEISGNTTQFRLKVDFEKTDSEFSILKELVQKNEDIHFYNEIHDIYLKMKSIQVRISESIFLDEVIQAITISKNELTPSVEVFNSKVGDYLNYLEKEIHSSRENLDKFVVFKVWQIIICSVLFLAFIFYVIIRIQTDLDFELKRLENDLYKLSKGDILTIKPVIVFHEFARVNSLVADVAAFWKNVDGNIEALSAEKGGYFFMNKLSDREQISTRLNLIAAINQNRVTEIESLQTRFQRTEWIFNGL
ncbi:MAG: hypothetical protein RIS47_1846, partial [Bacteroidota bacterium]